MDGSCQTVEASFLMMSMIYHQCDPIPSNEDITGQIFAYFHSNWINGLVGICWRNLIITPRRIHNIILLGTPGLRTSTLTALNIEDIDITCGTEWVREKGSRHCSRISYYSIQGDPFHPLNIEITVEPTKTGIFTPEFWCHSSEKRKSSFFIGCSARAMATQHSERAAIWEAK